MPPPLGGRSNDVAATRPRSGGAGPGAVTAVAILTLVLGLVIGFFLGRATEADRNTTSAASPLTSPESSTSRPPGDTIPQRTPVDPDAPPSTDLDPSTIGTLEDPIPAGQTYVLGLYEIEVRSVDRDAGETLSETDPSNPPAPSGRQHLIVEIAVRFTDGQGFGNPSSIPFFVSDGSDRWNDVDARCGVVPDSILDTALLEQGDETVANTCFTVPTDVVDRLLFGTEGVNGALYFSLPT